MYYVEHKLKKKNGRGLGMRLTGCVVALLGGIHKQVCVTLNDKLMFGGGGGGGVGM